VADRGHPSTLRVPSVFDYLVFVDGHQTTRCTGDPLAALHHAELAKAEHPDFPVVVVVLDAEEASYSEREYACRPFMVRPADQAADAAARVESERAQVESHQPGVSRTASGRLTQTAALPARSLSSLNAKERAA